MGGGDHDSVLASSGLLPPSDEVAINRTGEIYWLYTPTVKNERLSSRRTGPITPAETLEFGYRTIAIRLCIP